MREDRCDRADARLSDEGYVELSFLRNVLLQPEADGRRRIAVNLRLAAPETVADIPIEHFDGRATFDDLGRDGPCVRDYWS